MKLPSLLAPIIFLASCTPGTSPNPPASQNTGWTRQNGNTTHRIVDITFANPKDGFYTTNDNGMFRSSDSGHTWTRVFPPNFPDRAITLNFRNAQHGFGIGNNFFAFTFDGGQNWQYKHPLFDAWDIQFITPATGFATSHLGLFRTADTGTTWQQARPERFSSLTFASAERGWAMNTNPFFIYHTTDSGSTWTQQHTSSNDVAHSIFALNASAVWACGSGFILRTTNGGQNWSRITIPFVAYDIQFLDPSLGYAAGADGKVYKSTDGGFTWAAETGASVNGSLYELHFLNTNHGWAAGDNGAILHWRS